MSNINKSRFSDIDYSIKYLKEQTKCIKKQTLIQAILFGMLVITMGLIGTVAINNIKLLLATFSFKNLGFVFFDFAVLGLDFLIAHKELSGIKKLKDEKSKLIYLTNQLEQKKKNGYVDNTVTTFKSVKIPEDILEANEEDNDVKIYNYHFDENSRNNIVSDETPKVESPKVKIKK